MKPLTLQPHEIRRLQSAGEVLVVREVPNPNTQDWLSGLDWSKCPYSPGDRLWVREVWYAERTRTRLLVNYRADGDEYNNWYDRGFKWLSPVLMPKEASRFTVEVVTVECKGVQGATPDELEQTGERASWDVALVGNPWCWFVLVKKV